MTEELFNFLEGDIHPVVRRHVEELVFRLKVIQETQHEPLAEYFSRITKSQIEYLTTLPENLNLGQIEELQVKHRIRTNVFNHEYLKGYSAK